MPIRINLKELIGSDSQDITIDKINFNFNKLLELGIGLKGNKGFPGKEGSAGPHGEQGNEGDRGNVWYVGSGNPNSKEFEDLQDGDMYVDTGSNVFYQYSEDSDSWSQYLDISSIVNEYITQTGSAFIRGFGKESPDDSRFIVFPNRGNNVADFSGDSIENDTVNNDILFLSNFNEKLTDIVDIYQLGDTSLFNALQSLYVRARVGDERSHMDFGTLYVDSLNKQGGGTSAKVLTEQYNNLKIRHQVIDQSSFPGLSYLYKGIFSITNVILGGDSNIDDNTMLEFQTSSLDPTGSITKDKINVRIGGAYGLQYHQSSNDYINGISIDNGGLDYGTIGIMPYSTENPLSDYLSGDYFAIKSSSDGVFIDNAVYQNNGNIEQLGLNLNEIGTLSADSGKFILPGTNRTTIGYGGLVSIGNVLYCVNGAGATSSSDAVKDLTDTVSGSINVVSINNPNSPSILHGTAISGRTTGDYISGTALSDVDVIDNEYIILVNNQYEDSTGAIYNQDVNHLLTYFQIAKYDRYSNGFIRTSKIGRDSSGGETTLNADVLRSAWRCIADGSIAIVASNSLRCYGSDSVSYTSNYSANGIITTININNLDVPTIIQSDTATRRNYLDIAKIGGGIASINIYIHAPGNPTSFSGHSLYVTYHKISAGGSTITYEETLITSLSNSIDITNYDDLSVINAWGAIDTSGSYAYSVHSKNLYIHKLNQVTAKFSLVSSQQFSTYSNYVKAMDCKVVGEDLYILAIEQTSADAYNPTPEAAKVYKYKITNGSSVQKTSEITISGMKNVSRLEVVGNCIYIIGADDTRKMLVTTEVDGIKTSHANIGNIKTSDVNVIDHLIVGNNAKIGQGLTVGSGGTYSVGDISTDKILRGRGMYITSSRNYPTQAIALYNPDLTDGNGMYIAFRGNSISGTNTPFSDIKTIINNHTTLDATVQISHRVDGSYLIPLTLKNGNVGIRVDDPQARLDTYQATAASKVFNFKTGNAAEFYMTGNGYGGFSGFSQLAYKTLSSSGASATFNMIAWNDDSSFTITPFFNTGKPSYTRIDTKGSLIFFQNNNTDAWNRGIYFNMDSGGYALQIQRDGKVGIGATAGSINTTLTGSRFCVDSNISIGSSYYNTAAPTDGMIIEGNVGIGTDSPSSSYKLDVNGKIRLKDTLYIDSTDNGASENSLFRIDDGHLRAFSSLSDGTTPSLSGSIYDTYAGVSVRGNDIAGTVEVESSYGLYGGGKIVTVNYRNAYYDYSTSLEYSSTPTVVITPVTEDTPDKHDNKYYVKSYYDRFEIWAAGSPGLGPFPAEDYSLKWNYHVIEYMYPIELGD